MGDAIEMEKELNLSQGKRLTFTSVGFFLE